MVGFVSTFSQNAPVSLVDSFVIAQTKAEAKLFPKFFITKIILKKCGANLRNWLPEVVPRTLEWNLILCLLRTFIVTTEGGGFCVKAP